MSMSPREAKLSHNDLARNITLELEFQMSHFKLLKRSARLS